MSLPSLHRANEPSDSSRCGRLIDAGLWVLTLSILLVFVFTTLTLKKAAPIEESRAAARVYHLHPYAIALGAAAGAAVCVGAAILAVGDARRRRYGRAASMALTAAAAVTAAHRLIWGVVTHAAVTDIPPADSAAAGVSIAALAAASLLWAFRRWSNQSGETCGHRQADHRVESCLRRVTAHGLLKAVPADFLTAWCVSTAVCLPVVCTVLCRAEGYAAGLTGAIALSLAGIGLFSLLICGALYLLRVALVLAANAGLLAGRAAATIGMITGLAAFATLEAGINLSFGNELRALSVSAMVTVTLFVVGLFYGVGVSAHLLTLCGRENHPRQVGDLIRTVVLAGVLWPVLAALRWLDIPVRPSRRLLLVGGLTIAALLAALIPALFPAIEDFLDRIQFLLVILIVLLTVLAGRLLAPRINNHWRAGLASLTLLTAGSLVLVFGAGRSLGQSRPRVFRHDPLGKYSLTVVEGLAHPGASDSKGEAPTMAAPTPTSRRPLLDEIRRKRPLTVLIIWDACRPDHMSLYGHTRDKAPLLKTTPHLDAHADEFLRFTNAFSQATATSCSLRHLFTGRHASRYMLKTRGIAPFWTNNLLAHGYHTLHLNIIGSDYNGLSVKAFYRNMPAAMKANLGVFHCYGCPPDNRKKVPGDEQTYDAELPEQRADPVTLAAFGDKAKIIECNRQNEGKAVDDLLAFLATRSADGGAGVFAFIHMDATHTPWLRFEEVEDFGDAKLDRYDQTVRYSDFQTGRLIAGLKRLGMWEDTLMVVTADHGTGLDDHGVYGGFHPWFEQVHIPLVVKIPGVRGRKIDSLVGLFDIGPTLMDIFDPPATAGLEGRSLWPVIFGERDESPRVLFGLNSFADCYFLVDQRGWHYIRHRGDRYEQLYDWRKNPAETRDILGLPGQAKDLCRKHMDWFLNDQGHNRSYNNPRHY